MRWRLGTLAAIVAVSASVSLGCAPDRAADGGEAPLVSWNDGAAKTRVIDFVARVTRPGSADFVPPAERIAVFDNDGTLWVEQPMYSQFLFAMDRVRALAPEHPEWAGRQPFQAAIDGDLAAVAAGGEHGLVEVVAASHSGLTTDEFDTAVEEWLTAATHPTLGRRYTELVYQPMLELLGYLREHDFKTFVVSGGGVEFVRGFAEEIYGIPPEQVIGSALKERYEVREGVPVLVKLPEIDFVDDKAGKPVGIQRIIGRRPVMAFGNSDGDFEMLEWTTGGPGPRFAALVHHDDEAREFAYDKASAVGRLDRGLAEAGERGWTVVSMRQDWNRVFGFEQVK